MAALATPPESTLVDIVFDMATQACTRRRRPALLFLHRSLVTVLAPDLPVRAIEPIIRLVMVEIPAFPGTGVVTGFAIDAQLPLVRIGLFVAAEAFGRRIAVGKRLVTFFAFGARVRPDQRVTRPVMVEFLHFPAALVVAIVATLAQLALVALFIIVLAVA